MEVVCTCSCGRAVGGSRRAVVQTRRCCGCYACVRGRICGHIRGRGAGRWCGCGRGVDAGVAPALRQAAQGLRVDHVPRGECSRRGRAGRQTRSSAHCTTCAGRQRPGRACCEEGEPNCAACWGDRGHCVRACARANCATARRSKWRGVAHVGQPRGWGGGCGVRGHWITDPDRR